MVVNYLYIRGSKNQIAFVNPPENVDDWFGDNDDEQLSRLVALLHHLGEDFFLCFDDKQEEVKLFSDCLSDEEDNYEDYLLKERKEGEQTLSFYEWCEQNLVEMTDDWEFDDITNEFSNAKGNDSYRVLDDVEATEAAEEYIKDTVWAFDADFIVSECGLHWSLAEMIKVFQEQKSEDANDGILSLIESCTTLKEFAESAIGADGRGHFLNGYDGNEVEVTICCDAKDSEGKVVESFVQYDYCIYRTN
jgi:hypothetical protein